jgi:LysR family transcriptional regulator, nitrogen assimilation regulatory protein
MHNPPRHRGIEIEPLLTEPMYLIGPGPAAKAAPPVKILPPVKAGMALSSVPLILPNRTHGLRMLVERAVAEAGGHVDVVLQVEGYATTKALTAAGLGYTVLPYSAARREIGTGELSAARIHRPALAAWTLSAAYRKDQGPARAVTALRNIIATAVSELEADGFWDEVADKRGQKKHA